MSLVTDDLTQKIILNSALGGASAYLLTSVPVVGGVIFGASIVMAVKALNPVFAAGGSSMQKTIIFALHIFLSLAAAWAVTSLLIGTIPIKTAAVLSGGLIAGHILHGIISSLAEKIFGSSFA